MKSTIVFSLGKAQNELELATAALKAANANLVRAQERQSKAERRHEVATSALLSELQTVRGKAKVSPTGY